MVQYNAPRLDASFAALSDSTRRGILERLARADSFAMTLTGMKKHVSVLEEAGLVATEKVGRVRMCKLGASGLEAEAAWLRRHREQWEDRFTALDKVVAELQRRETDDEPK